MSRLQRLHGVKVLKAVSSTVRLRILNLLSDSGPLLYTELMNLLKMNPSRDAGRFAYHLKFLLKADLIEVDVESKKYRLSELGKMVMDVVDGIERKAFMPKRTLVRTSRFALEEFDVNRIADSLIKEANMPVELSRKVARETEKRLRKAKTKYLTAPLIREVVNAILIEKGLEDYRHKLTRLGLPVYDITALLARSETVQGLSSIHETAGKTVVEEYTLLHVLPRDVADAYLSGVLHIDGLNYWILKPSEVAHDLRFFLQRGLNLEHVNVSELSYPPPKSLEAALSIVSSVLFRCSKEVGETQTLSYFNVFLAPFIKNVEPARVKEALSLFIFDINQLADASLGLELVVPDFIADKPAIGPFGKPVGNYGDFSEESRILASLILEIFAEESGCKPLLNPKIVVKTRPETFADEKAKAILLEAHLLASEKGIPYFANLSQENGKHSVYSAYGYKLKADLKGDWEVDTLRTGNLGSVAINLPRIAYECENDKAKFSELLKIRLEMATRALEIKYGAVKQHGKGLLPFLMQTVDGDQYFRVENSTRLINLIGLREAVENLHGRKNIHEDREALKFAEETLQYVSDFTHKILKRRGRGFLPAILPNLEASERLAKLDIERYGIAKVRFMGMREKPYYSTVGRINLRSGEVPSEFLKAEGKLHGPCAGGNLTVIDLGETEHKPDELMSLTKDLIENYGIGFFTYHRDLTYCVSCKRSWFGLLHKCPSCSSVSTLTTFKRYTA